MILPKKPYYWSWSVDADRNDGNGITEVSQSAYIGDDPQDLAAAIAQAITAACHYVAMYSAVQITLQATCAKCSGAGDVAVPMKRVRGRRKTCSDCKGVGRYADALLGPIQICAGEQHKIVEKEQIIRLEQDLDWDLSRPLKKGDEITLRTDQGESGKGELFNKEGYVCRSWPDGEILGTVPDNVLTDARTHFAMTYYYV